MTDPGEMKEIFNSFDKDHSGFIDPAELLQLLRALGMDPTADDLAMAIEGLDVNHDGKISFSEFFDWWDQNR